MDLLISPIPELHSMNPEIGEGPLGTIKDAAIAFDEGKVCYVGPSKPGLSARKTVDGRGCVLLPGLVDCHTHSLFAGSRSDEFRRRLAGESYSSILEEGGGILSTVRATRAASNETLIRLLESRLSAFLRSGVTTVEVKSGYGLSVEEELRLCRIIGRDGWPVSVHGTFLGAHAIPIEWRSDREGYVQAILNDMIPHLGDLVQSIDVYCDRGAFELDESRRILQAGIDVGLQGRVHAEQVAFTGVAELAAGMGCLSADHLEQIDASGIEAMGTAGMVAVLLPGAQLYLRDPAPPARALVEAGARLAVATDFNPGSSPVRDLLACATLACINMGLTVEEAFLGITKNAALALGRHKAGWLGEGSSADAVLFELPPGESEASALVQYLGGHRTRAVIRNGLLAWAA